MPDYSAAAYDFIRAFRKGELGKVMLDCAWLYVQDWTLSTQVNHLLLLMF